MRKNVNIQDLNKQIEEFFKKDKEITKVPVGQRALEEYVWYQDTYPKNFNKVNRQWKTLFSVT